MVPGSSAVRRARPWVPWAVVALAAGVAAVAGSYLAVGRRPAFVGTPLDRFVLAASPDAVVSVAITELGEYGHVLAFATALALACLLLAVTAIPAVLALRDGRSAVALVLAIALPTVTTLVLTFAPVSSLGAGLGAGVTVVVAILATHEGASLSDGALDRPRRRVLGTVGTAIGIGALGALVQGSGSTATPSAVDIPEDARPAVREALTQAQAQSLAVEGMEPLVSTDFYEVDINNVNPTVEREGWTLSIFGDVAEERELTFEDLAAMDVENRFVTLRCVGDRLNGDQMDNALWSGVPVASVLEMAGPEGDRVVLRGADNYYNEFPIEALRPGMLAYEMNGRPLPRGHGAPVRALVPGHWGEINVKWLTEIEVRDEDTQGYWEQRGWHGTGPVNTVAKLWHDAHLGSGRMEVAGHAYAGTRGIQAVEVSTDGGETWTEAELSDPLPGDDVWRQWRHEYTAADEHEVVVRAYDGNGDVQIPEQDGPRPDGATGWVSKTLRPR